MPTAATPSSRGSSILAVAATREHGYYFAPIRPARWSPPSAQRLDQRRGPHCLKYGITVNHVLGLEVSTGSGEILTWAGRQHDHPGDDLTGALVGGEGTLGLLTAINRAALHVQDGVRTLLRPSPRSTDASEAVSRRGAGIIRPRSS